MSSCSSDVLCNDGDSVNFSSWQLEQGNISVDDGDGVTAGLAQVKSNAESFMQELASCFFIFFV